MSEIWPPLCELSADLNERQQRLVDAAVDADRHVGRPLAWPGRADFLVGGDVVTVPRSSSASPVWRQR